MAASTEVRIPDIGDFADVPVIDISVAVGDTVEVDDSLVTLESDKATMDIPAPMAGTVASITVSIGDRVSEGVPIMTITGADADEAGAKAPSTETAAAPPDAEAAAEKTVAQQEPDTELAPDPTAASRAPAERSVEQADIPAPADEVHDAHAGPSVRRLARELEVDLSTIAGTGPKGRITKEDLLSAVRGPAAAPGAPAVPTGTGIPPIPAQDFSKFGEVETVALSRIKRLSGPHLLRSWLNIPHVTHNDEADITEIDAYRKTLDTEAKADGYRVTLLSFLLKAVVSGLKAFPEFNASLSPDGASLIVKHYYNVGIAVDTPEGLVVPVLKDVDRKGIIALSREMGEISKKARDGKLSAADMSGGCFTISSLGGIGGTSFTPIVNAPEVAILGVVRSKQAPVWDGSEFVARLMLPLSLSYDHRVIDGALAARFSRHLATILEDVRRLVL